MAEERFSHIFIKRPPQAIDYTSPKISVRKTNIPNRNRQQHGNFLKRNFEKLWEQSEKEKQDRQAVALPVRSGHYIEFRSQAGFDLITKSLEDIRSGIRLSNIREEKIYSQDKKNNRVIKISLLQLYIVY